tara:strand:- start:101 stop:283 length:183 start_codon:yes stop_codon:yes gene_type:complete
MKYVETKEEVIRNTEDLLRLELENIENCNRQLSVISRSHFVSEQFVKKYQQELKELTSVN